MGSREHRQSSISQVDSPKRWGKIKHVHCFACNADLALASGERIGFRDDCHGCSADLHVCRNCTHHDPNAYNECRESNAERVLDPERANRCDYFSPSSASPSSASPSNEKGSGNGGRQPNLAALEDLFKK